AAFIGGTVPVRTGMTKVGLPGAKEGWQKSDPTIAALLKDKGYATGQFGKNHFGDRDEHLPTMHGFDEYFGSLYHLNASEEPENEDYPKDPEFLKRFGPRGVIRAKADGKGGQSVEDTGPLTKKRMETIDEETLASAKDFITRNKNANKPFFCWWNATRMHFRTHVKAANRGKSGQDEYSDGMVEHDGQVGEILKLLDDLGIANDTIVFYSTDKPRRSAARKPRTGKVPTVFPRSCVGRVNSPPGRRSTGSSRTRTGWLPSAPRPGCRT